MRPLLPLDTAPKTSVFRAIDTLLRNDPTLKRIFGKPGSFRSWTGEPHDAKPFDRASAPAIRLTPTFGPSEFVTPASLAGNLWVNVELVILGTHYDDLINVWYAIEKAIYPTNPTTRNSNILTLQQAGTRRLVQFSQPAFEPSPDEGYFTALGQISGQVEEFLNP